MKISVAESFLGCDHTGNTKCYEQVQFSCELEVETIQTACLTDSGNHALLSQEKHDTELFNNMNFHILQCTDSTTLF